MVDILYPIQLSRQWFFVAGIGPLLVQILGRASASILPGLGARRMKAFIHRERSLLAAISLSVWQPSQTPGSTEGATRGRAQSTQSRAIASARFKQFWQTIRRWPCNMPQRWQRAFCTGSSDPLADGDGAATSVRVKVATSVLDYLLKLRERGISRRACWPWKRPCSARGRREHRAAGPAGASCPGGA